MSEQRRCLGFGETEGKCENPAGCRWSDWWCEGCNAVRMEHISWRLERLAYPTPEKEPSDEG